ncbi:MAG: hypothetical protein LBL39_02530 [Planctomycetaceae bacterium]|jgi:hypothetical protein|nr:hypothetical protein [Planctomycetaceae bacterium]
MRKTIISLTCVVLFTFAVTTFASAQDATATVNEPKAEVAKAAKPCPHCQAAVYQGCCDVAPTVIYRRTWFGLGAYYKPVVAYPACAPAPVYRAYPVYTPRYYYPAYPVYPAYPAACCW